MHDLNDLYLKFERVFGSVCYPLVVPASKRVAAHPLKYPSSCGIFLGYAENCPGAVCLDPVTGKLSVRRDLVVDENYRFHRPTVGAPSLHHINPAINAPVPAPVELVPISDAVHVPPPKQLHDTASRYVIDVCAGTSSALRYHLSQDEHAQVLAIDILPFEKVIAHIPAHQRHRFSYVRMSMDALDMQVMRKIVYDAWSVTMDRVDMIHWSHPCQTYSEAHHNNNFHRNGLQPLTDKARHHDSMLAKMAMLFEHISAACFADA